MDDRLSADELAELARCSLDRVQDLTDVGLLHPAGGRYARGDVHRIRLVESFESAGVPADALARASRGGTITFDYYDQLHQDPGTPSDRTYGELLADLGDRAAALGHLYGAFGIAEPEPTDRLSQSEEQLLLVVLDALEANRDRDLALRAFRVLGDAARRGSEAAMSVYAEAVERATGDIAGIPPMEVYERFLEPWARIARLVPDLSAWLHARHLSSAIDTWSVAETERMLAETGFVRLREVEPPAIAFIDLTGFTRLAEARGDRVAAGTAIEFTSLVSRIADETGGRLVKPLGDGALLRFPSARTGVDATLDILDRLEPAGLPPGHAGIDAGPVIVREGDVFGRTVNLASRIADRAETHQLLCTAALADTLAAGSNERHLRYEPVGAATLQGVAEPVELVRIRRAPTAPGEKRTTA
jgi:adenylate cyclase